LIFWSGIKLQAQDFTPFKERIPNEKECANDLFPLIKDSTFKELLIFKIIQSNDSLIRIIPFEDENEEKHLLVEWNYKGNCVSQLLETDAIGYIQEVKQYRSESNLNYFITSKIQIDGNLYLFCHHLQIDTIKAIFKPMRFHSTREEDYLCVDISYRKNNSIHFIENEIHYKEEISNLSDIKIIRNRILNFDSLEQRMVMVEINEELIPPIEKQIPDTLFRNSSLIGKEKIRTYILQYVDMNGDEGNSQLCDLFKVIYLFRGQKFESELYTLTNPETEEKFDFSQFLPEYVQLTDGRVLLKTQNLYNALRSGMCGTCDFWDFSIHEVNKKSSQIVFNAAINLGMQSNSYEIYKNGNVIQSSHFRIANDDAELNFNDVIWIRNKTWKIRFYEGEDSREVYLKISPEKGLTGLTNLNTSTKKKTKRV
jgi:hypothetical protein